MLSAVLRSSRAVQMSINIIRAFIRMRELIASNKDIAARVKELERGHDRTASVIEVLAEDIERLAHDVKQMKNLPVPSKRKSVLTCNLCLDDEANPRLQTSAVGLRSRAERDSLSDPPCMKCITCYSWTTRPSAYHSWNCRNFSHVIDEKDTEDDLLLLFALGSKSLSDSTALAGNLWQG